MMVKQLCLSSWPLLLSSLLCLLLLQSTSTLVLATTTTDQVLQVEYAYGDGSTAFFADDEEEEDDNADVNSIGNHNEWRSASLPSASDDTDDDDDNDDDEEHHHDDHDDHDDEHHDHDDHDHDHADGGCRFHRLSQADEIADSARMTAWRAKRFDSSNNNSVNNNNLFLRGKAATTPQKYTIPVYVHVVQANFFYGNQSDEDIAAALKYLNEAFSKAAAPFVFAHKATTRTTNAKWGEGCGNDQIEMEFKKALKKGGADVLNLYLCPKIVDQRGSVLNGYAFAPFPGSETFMRDGVVVAGRGLPQHNTIVHEVGHYMGLFHTFGTSCNERDGDQVNDTPVHTNKFAHAIANCGVSKVIPWDSCPNAPGKDPLNNYMSYVKNSECRSQFTKGQVERMLGQYELYRNKGPKIAVTAAPPPPSCLAFLSTCQVDADCCGQNSCVFFSASNRHLCWL